MIPQSVAQIQSEEEVEVDAVTLRSAGVIKWSRFIEDVMKAFTSQVSDDNIN